MYILDKIKALRDEKTPNEIEDMLLNGELGEIGINNKGYQYIGNLAISWLVIEAHESGFIGWMNKHPNKNVVHHKDGNILNNAYLNLQLMSRGTHARMHVIAYLNDPKNAETIKVKRKKQSKSLRAYFSNPENAEAEKARNENHIKTCKEMRTVPETLGEFFTVEEYAKVSGISETTIYDRLTMLLCDGKITCEKRQIGSKRWKNVYRRRLSLRS